MKYRRFLPMVTFLLMVIILGFAYWFKVANQIPKDDFKAPTKSWSSQKKVQDYFVEKLRFTQKDLESQKNNPDVDFRPGSGSTIEAIISNLHYYGFIRSEKAFRYALENTKDTTNGNPGALTVGKNGSIDIVASYRISENMSAWELADTLLNKSHYFGPSDEYGYMFMP
jgi:hypothetical protein